MKRDELVEKLLEMTKVDEEDILEYLATGDEYLDTLPEDTKVIDGDDQLDYIYEHSNLDPNVIEKISDAEFELLYSSDEEE